MHYLKNTIGILLILCASRFIPHPPNFTSLIAIAFYIPLLLGKRFIFSTLICFIFTDLIIGLHSTIFFTWSSVLVIGFLSKFYNGKGNITKRLGGALTGSFIFFIISNFGVWTLGGYGYTLNSVLECYTMALPFFGYTLISTLLFAIIIETIYFLHLNYFKKKFNF